MSPARCRHWMAARGGYCHNTDQVRRYLVGPRCPTHTPAAVVGRPDPPEATRVRVLVTGSRTWTNTATIHTVLDRLHAEHGPALVVVHGACPRGADAIAHAWARNHRVPVEAHPADWRTGRAGGPARNAAMVATRPQACVAFIRDHSPGATRCADLAAAAGIPTTVHHTTGEETVMSTRQHPSRPAGVLRAALGYAARGWPVFLLGRSKRPVANCPGCTGAGPDHDRAGCPCLTCHGFYAASTDPDRIAAMFAALPDGLLAIRTGAASGLVVVDIDPRNGGALDPALMPPTAAVATGGGGWHLYYTHPGQPVACTTLPDRLGVDIKADGGYVLAPPATHPGTGRRYRWVGDRPVVEMPPALLDHLAAPPTPPPPPTVPRPTPTTSTAGGGGISSPTALLTAHLHAVHTAPPGRRRVTLYGAARGVARMVAAGAITPTQARQALYAAGRAAEQTDRDIRAAITGGFHAEGVAA